VLSSNLTSLTRRERTSLPEVTGHPSASASQTHRWFLFQGESCAGESDLIHRCRAAPGCRPWRIGDVNCDDETSSIRRMHASPGGWRRSKMVGILDIPMGPAVRNSSDRDTYRSTRSHSRRYHARSVCGWPRASRSSPWPRHPGWECDEGTAARCRREVCYKRPCSGNPTIWQFFILSCNHSEIDRRD